jgi:hypothetical protein
MSPTANDSTAISPTPTATKAPAPKDASPEEAATLGTRNTLFARRMRAPQIEKVRLSDGKDYEIAGISPYEMAWITEQGISRDLEEGKVDVTTVERNFYMVAIALRENGQRMFPGEPDNAHQWHYGAKKVATELDNVDFDKLFKAVNHLSGYSREARAAAGKGFAKTLTPE